MTDYWEQRWTQGNTTWDHGRASPPLEDYVNRYEMRGSAVVPGCGAGHEVRLLARKGLTVTGVDLASGAIAKARSFPPAGGERYLQTDWLKLQVGLGSKFDWVVEHTCLCALEPWRRSEYADAVEFALGPGGHLLGVFYLDPPNPEGPPYGISPGELNELFNRFHLIARWRPTEGFESRLGREEMRLYRKV